MLRKLHICVCEYLYKRINIKMITLEDKGQD